MKLREVISYVDSIKPNAFSDEVKVQWINEVEGYVQTDVMLLDILEVLKYSYPKDMDTELLVANPHSKIYYTYLVAMVDFANGEYNKYANTLQMYNEFLNEYMIWYADHYRPADGMAVAHGYYISAYGIAVKHGYEGTEEQWLSALVGPQGKPFTYDDFTPAQLELLRGPQGEFVSDISQKDSRRDDGTVVHEVTVATNAGRKMMFTLTAERGLTGNGIRDARLNADYTLTLVLDNGTEITTPSIRGEKGDAFRYEDFTQEQLAALKGKQGDEGKKGDPGVFVQDDDNDVPADDDTVMVDVREKEEEEISIPDGLLREGDQVWLMCEDEKIGSSFTVRDGKDGRNFKILGYYSSLELLRLAVPDPDVGDAYGVGTASPYHIYVYDAVSNDWLDNGTLSGVAGADGVGIESIVQTSESSASGGANVMTVTLTDGTKKTFTVYNGKDGKSGNDGKDGKDGQSPNLSIGTVNTGAAGSQVSATITGEYPNLMLNLVIPRGFDGEDGQDGQSGKDGSDGKDGQSINLSIGTVTTGAAGSQASASLTGTFPNVKLNLTIPKGDTGDGANITVDTAMSDDSANPVQNKVVKKYVDELIGDIGTALDAILGGGV